MALDELLFKRRGGVGKGMAGKDLRLIGIVRIRRGKLVSRSRNIGVDAQRGLDDRSHLFAQTLTSGNPGNNLFTGCDPALDFRCRVFGDPFQILAKRREYFSG